ncbi:hypothetical protein [Janthinobacterium aquaticum]|uniref:hypothetical protein n=1 Tax=Janthinobacterium sp. FT58W TaxID=2654254 RepID=UPI001264AE34|nr:hypothetical protein [Janthinobacterium sp. FT58W]KAB8042567.1 hypothetical protein GCM43_13675 [Janthinobacterium sp. FT58W]
MKKLLLFFTSISIASSATTWPHIAHAQPAGNGSCYAKALPTKGHGGHDWANDIQSARNNALAACRKNAAQTGGTPNTCKIVESHCRPNK